MCNVTLSPLLRTKGFLNSRLGVVHATCRPNFEYNLTSKDEVRVIGQTSLLVSCGRAKRGLVPVAPPPVAVQGGKGRRVVGRGDSGGGGEGA